MTDSDIGSSRVLIGGSSDPIKSFETKQSERDIQTTRGGRLPSCFNLRTRLGNVANSKEKLYTVLLDL